MNHYEHLLQLHESGRIQGPEYNHRLKRLIAGYHATQFFFKRLIPSDANVADVGCYYGQWSYPLLEKVKEVTFLDYKDEHFPYLKTLLGSHTLNAHLVKHDFCQESLLGGGKRFDVILCMGTLNAINPLKLEMFCRNMVSSLKDGGYLFVDMRDPPKTWLFYEFILNLNGIVRLMYAPRLKVLSLPPLSFVGKIKIIKNYFENLARAYLSNVMQGCLKKFIKRDTRAISINWLQDILQSCGLFRLSLNNNIDKEFYEMLRGIEGFNLTNTFVGNYFWLGIYQKPHSDKKSISL